MDYKNDYPIIYDFHYAGGLDKSGALNDVWNEEALNNSIRMWLASYRAEVLRRPSAGGYVAPLLMRPMGEVDVDVLRATIRNGFTADFRPLVKIQSLEIVPNYENRYWEVYIEVFSPDLGVYTKVNEKIKNSV